MPTLQIQRASPGPSTAKSCDSFRINADPPPHVDEQIWGSTSANIRKKQILICVGVSGYRILGCAGFGMRGVWDLRVSFACMVGFELTSWF